MNYSRALLAATACACITFLGASAVASTPTAANKQAEPKGAYGQIIFYDGDGNKHCMLSVPETKQFFDLADDSQSCTNNQVASFSLENIPSATLIHFYRTEVCSDAKVQGNFFVKLKTVKQPTDWSNPSPNPPATMNFDDFRKLDPGYLVPKKFIRIEDRWPVPDVHESWDEQISCVYIERSQPVY
ncbi:hypothetical protein SOP85_30150 [Pseudomonas sp. YuFO20]|uniref:hypothetical protein n=1 Tax=Pseudomonas sp. YuFO20 TaxID=3095362 RepID=UPI002B256275|nr:hypothetical protein [Pseudomonas sp. YuFO20]MEB2519653.1 hypothetical protein [Pseudomonas sp. YuFO20]